MWHYCTIISCVRCNTCKNHLLYFWEMYLVSNTKSPRSGQKLFNKKTKPWLTKFHWTVRLVGLIICDSTRLTHVGFSWLGSARTCSPSHRGHIQEWHFEPKPRHLVRNRFKPSFLPNHCWTSARFFKVAFSRFTQLGLIIGCPNSLDHFEPIGIHA